MGLGGGFIMSDKESPKISNYFYVKRKIFWLKYFPDLTWAQEILPSETKYTTLPLARINKQDILLFYLQKAFILASYPRFSLIKLVQSGNQWDKITWK